MILLIILTILLLMLSFILLAQIRLVIHTDKGMYKADYGRWISLRMLRRRQGLYLRLRLLFINMYFQPWQKRPKPEAKSGMPRIRPGRKSFSLKRLIRLLKTMRSSVVIKKLSADIDTGDFPLNAQLIPVASQFSGENREVRINFEDRNQLELIIQTRLITIIWNYFLLIFKN